MKLIVKNKIIEAPIKQILDKIVAETHRTFFKDRVDNGDNLTVTCPHHKNGNEQNPSCNIMQNIRHPSVIYGTVHCFTCGYKATLAQLVADCFNFSLESGEDWLYERFGGTSYQNDLPLIVLDKRVEPVKYLNESILKQYDFYHPYMWKRHLTKDVVDKFQVGYDKQSDSLTFPVWDINGKLVAITKRSVNSKKFYIEKSIQKPVYLLNFLLKEHSTVAYIAESQINALTLQGWGYPGVAMFGGCSKYQLDLLRRSGIRRYVLCFDGDAAGDQDITQFIKYMPSDVLISIKQMPRDGRDINDLTKEEFENLKEIFV